MDEGAAPQKARAAESPLPAALFFRRGPRERTVIFMHDAKKKRAQYGEHIEVFPNLSDTASANECTGLMPTPPVTPDEYESYQELHSMEVPKKLPGRREFQTGIYDDKPEEITFQ
jgi:hypothetical protein